MKLLEENIREIFLDIVLGNEIQIGQQKHRQQSKMKQMALNQTKKLLHVKGINQENERITYRMGENICVYR